MRLQRLEWTLLLAALLSGESLAVSTWSGAGTANWNDSASWDAAPVSGNTLDLIFSVAGYAFPVTRLGGGDFTVRSITFNVNMDTTPAGIALNNGGSTSKTLTFDTDAVGGTASLIVDNGAEAKITIGTGAGTTYGTVILADNLNITHNGSGTLVFDRAINGTGYGISKNGSGTMVLAVGNGFTGGLTLNAGTVVASGGATVPTDIGSGPVVFAGGTLVVSNANWGGNKGYTVAGVTLTAAASTVSTLEYVNTSGTARNLTFSGAGNTTTLNGDLLVRNMNTEAGNVIALNQPISGAGMLSYEGNNELTANYTDRRLQLAGANTNWNGGFELLRGGANFSGDSAFIGGTGPIILGEAGSANGAGLYINPTTAGTYTYSNNITVRSGTGLRSLRGVGDMTFVFTGALALEGDLNIDMALTVATRYMQFTGNITGDGGLSLTRSGSTGDFIQLSGNNTYTGDTVIGTNTELRISTGFTNGIGDLSRVVIVSNHVGQALNLRGGNETVGSLESESTRTYVTLYNANTLTVGNNNRSTTYAGYFTESGTTGGGLSKIGSGTLTLSGITNFSYSGATTIKEGALRFAADDLLYDASPLVLSGGTLELNGATDTVGTLNVTTNSTLALGDGTGCLTFSGDSSAQGWTGDLTLTGTLAEKGPTCVRFTHANRLTKEQLKRISCYGNRVGLDANGYLYLIKNGLILFFK